ncbi:hypothetical protein FRC11_005853 [Ceratobasidium sp. 423]|nr:hypothetical protein FRC11_005853 [Ceratobasidium sp. 423]
MAQADVERSALHSFESEQQLEAFRQLEATLDHPFHFTDHQPNSPSPQPAPFAQYTPLVGRTITSPAGPQYRLALRRVLGVGAYGVVYLAEQVERDERQYAWGPLSRHEREQTISSAGRMYAVKVMRCAPKGSRQRAFQAREVALHRRADGHPGIVPLHAVYGTGLPPTFSPRKRKTWNSHSNVVRPEDELTWDQDAELSGGPLPLLENGEEEELVYMVLSYIGGGDLFSMIAEKQRYIGNDALVRSVFTQLLDAVQWCHIQGVRHRDLKPENILCEQDGQIVFVSDFGLATSDRHSRDFGCGSSYYMSPECFGDPLAPVASPSYNTRANDVWTLGVVLVNLTTGRNPWEAASPLDATFKSYCNDPANFLPTILPITPAANQVFIRIFERDQRKRISIPELREMVSRVERWTLRGHELQGAAEGARDVAQGCGLLDISPTPIRGGSSGMAERSRFSEDTLLSSDEGEESSDGEVEWYALRRASGAQVKGSPDLPSNELKAKLSGDLKNNPKGKILHDKSPRELSKSSTRELSAKTLLSARELTSKTSFSTLSVASSESSGFPATPLKAEVILSSPRVIVSRPSDGKLWDVPRTSGADSGWEGSSTTGSHDAHVAVGLEPGAPLYDHHAFYRLPQLATSSPSLGTPRHAQKGDTSQKVKRVPVPPIPSELLEEHERQLTIKRNGAGRDRLFDSVAVPVVVPEIKHGSDDERAAKRSGLLDNARAWLRRI